MNKLSVTAACGIAIISLSACTSMPASASPVAGAAGVDLGPYTRITPALGIPPGEGHEKAPNDGAYQLVHQGHEHIRAVGTVNSLDEAKRTVNLSHGPIPQVGWPAMTMDFAVSPEVDLKAAKPGAKVEFTLEKGADGMYRIDSLKPAQEGR